MNESTEMTKFSHKVLETFWATKAAADDSRAKEGTQNVVKEIFGTVKDDCKRNLADSEKDEQEAAAE